MKWIKRTVLALLFIAPFFQGLYFMHQTFAYAALFTLILMVCFFVNKEIKIPLDSIFYVLLAISILYFIATVYSVDSGMAFFGGFKYLFYILFYSVLLQFTEKDLKEKLIDVLIIGNFIVAILVIFGKFSLPLYEKLFINGRFGGFIQYANTYGIFATVMLILILRKKVVKKLDYVMFVSIFTSICLTYSRSIIVICVLSIVVLITVDRRDVIQRLLASVGGAALGFVFTKIFALEEVGSRLNTISFNVSEWKTRLIYYIDSLEIIKDFPFGSGFGSYQYLQKAYRTGSPYSVKFVHNNILQFALEIGFLGAVLLCVFFLVLIVRKKVDLYSKLAIVVIFAHGVIDFDFQFPIIIMLILILSLKEDHGVITISPMKSLVISLLSILFMIYSTLFVATINYHYGDYESAYNILPFYSQAKMRHIREREEFTEENIKLCKELIENNPYWVEGYRYLSKWSYGENDYKMAFAYAKKLVRYNPLSIEDLEIFGKISLYAANEAYKKGEIEEAEIYLEEVLGIPNYLQELAKEKDTAYNVKHKVNFELTYDLLHTYHEGVELYSSLK